MGLGRVCKSVEGLGEVMGGLGEVMGGSCEICRGSVEDRVEWRVGGLTKNRNGVR